MSRHNRKSRGMAAPVTVAASTNSRQPGAAGGRSGLALSFLDGSFARRVERDKPIYGQASHVFSHAKTLGAPEEVVMAADAQLQEAGTFNLLQHAIDMGQVPGSALFMGYGALQNISQNGLVRACVETVADDMTRNWIEITRQGKLEDGQEDIIPQLEEAMRRHKLQSVFHQALEMVGYEGGCLIFIDTGATGNDLLQPLILSEYSAELGKGKPVKFRVLDPVNCFPGVYNASEPLRSDFYQPREWWVLGQRIHASRVLRIVANEPLQLLKPAYNFFGIPQAQLVYDAVLHFQEDHQAVSRLLNKFSTTVLKTGMSDILFGGAAAVERLDARINLMVRNRSNDGVMLIDKEGEEIVKLETPIGGLTDIVRQDLEVLVAKNRTPAVKLLGISPSGFNATGESDIRNYYDHIQSQQEKTMRDAITTVLSVLQLNIAGKIDPSISFDFAELGEEDEAALATRQKTNVDTMAVLLDRDVISVEEARKTLADDPDSGFNGIDPEEVPESNEMPDEPEAGAKGEAGGMEKEPEQAGEAGPPHIDDFDKAGAVDGYGYGYRPDDGGNGNG